MVVQSRYGGTYEGGAWHALPSADAGWMWTDAYSDYMFGGDEEAVNFWQSSDAQRVGRGETPNAAVLDLVDRHESMRQLENGERTDTEGSAQERTGSQNGEADEATNALLP